MDTQLIKQLRNKTCAGMGDCRAALEATSWDYERALDWIKVKNLATADSKATKVSAEGIVLVNQVSTLAAMVEINSGTDFCSRSPDFLTFSKQALEELSTAVLLGVEFVPSPALETARKELIAKTKENIVIRRHWHMEGDALTRVFSYVHSNNKMASLVSIRAKDETQANSPELATLGENLAMQVVGLGAWVVSADKLTPEQISRQKAIFEEQAKDKPEANRPKIVEGKMRKWQSEIVLLEQDSLAVPKKKVRDTLNGAEIVSFVRCVVGEGIETVKTDLAAEVAEMVNG
jgi:elongation factor Ts